MASSAPATSDGDDRPVRVIRRYANRKLYDTVTKEFSSLGRIEGLLRNGVDIRVLDHDTGADMTGEVLVGILGQAVGEGTAKGDLVLLTSLIRSPGDVLAAMFADEAHTEELRAMGERVRLLSVTIDALLGQADPTVPTAPAVPKKRKAPGSTGT